MPLLGDGSQANHHRVTTIMPMIDRISAASIGSRVTATGEHASLMLPWRRVSRKRCQRPTSGRQPRVCSSPSRTLTPSFAGAGLSMGERMEVKLALQRKGLLPAGRPVRVDY